MLNDFVLVGPGQLGQLYGAGALRAGYRVLPIRRHDDPSRLLRPLPARVPILVAVGEKDLPDALGCLPQGRREDVILLQNELFPSTWRAEGLRMPSVTVPWVLKKPGLPVTTARTSSVFGPWAAEMMRIHDALGLPVERLPHETALEQALVSKYVFILTINTLGLLRDQTLGQWLDDPGEEREAVLQEALHLGQAKLGNPVREARVRDDLTTAMAALSAFGSRGRTAPARVRRAVEEAQQLGVSVPTLQRVARSAGQ